MYNFLKENTFTDNVIHYQLLKFFWDKHEYILSEYNINFNQIKIIINQLIINQSSSINQLVTDALDSDDSDNSKDSYNSKDSKDSKDSADTIEIETENAHAQIPSQIPTQNQQQIPDLFNAFFGNQYIPYQNHQFDYQQYPQYPQYGGVPLIFDPLFNFQGNPYQQPHNILNLFNNFMPQQYQMNDVFLNQTGNIINDIFFNSNEDGLSNSQIDSLNNIIH
jgi:hypothetical protein